MRTPAVPATVFHHFAAKAQWGRVRASPCIIADYLAPYGTFHAANSSRIYVGNSAELRGPLFRFSAYSAWRRTGPNGGAGHAT